MFFGYMSRQADALYSLWPWLRLNPAFGLYHTYVPMLAIEQLYEWSNGNTIAKKLPSTIIFASSHYDGYIISLDMYTSCLRACEFWVHPPPSRCTVLTNVCQWPNPAIDITGPISAEEWLDFRRMATYPLPSSLPVYTSCACKRFRVSAAERVHLDTTPSMMPWTYILPMATSNHR